MGGGYIGLEMGQIFRRFGSDVTIIERAEHVASREDTDVSAEIERIFMDEGITLLTATTITRVSEDDGGTMHVSIEDSDGNAGSVRGSHLLVSTGRVPNTDTLNLGSIGLATDDRGYIQTNGRLETAVPGIWALGDINRRGAFTHTSYHDYEIVRDNHQGADRSADTRTMAYCMYTDPPLGRVGINETQARQSGKDILIARHRVENISRAIEDGDTNGLVKLIVDAETKQFLGATIFGMHGDDVVQVVSNYMATGATYEAMQQALPVHPTISEFFPTWLGMLEPLESD
jgi:pyruvate/2-oxoglutarate dehydrogenase complex dihydrolipoamide dehydrogenase (E3) component